MLPWFALLLYLARRKPMERPAILAVIGVNMLWVLGSIVLLLSGWVDPTALGYAVVILQAMAVVGFAEWQYLGLRRVTSMSSIATMG